MSKLHVVTCVRRYDIYSNGGTILVTAEYNCMNSLSEDKQTSLYNCMTGF